MRNISFLCICSLKATNNFTYDISTIRGIKLNQVANQLIEMYLILMLIIMFCAKLPNDISFTSP